MSVFDKTKEFRKSLENLSREDLLEIIKRTLESDEDLLISGFGKFCVRKKSKRKGRNPATGDDLILEKRKVVTFKCSSVLRDRVSG